MTGGGVIVVVGIGADGWAGLGEPARSALTDCQEVVGSRRQLALLPDTVSARRRPWPSPIGPLLDELVARPDDGIAVLASGDPMLHGIGATLAHLAPERLTVLPAPGALSLACARLGWPVQETELVSLVGRDPARVRAGLQPGRRLVVLVAGTDGAASLATELRAADCGASRFVVLQALGGPAEQVVETTASAWGDRAADPLHCVGVEVRRDREAARLGRTPGLPDAAYAGDGQLTKRHVRAVTLAALVPLPRAHLWDVGAGSGSIAIEWLRAEPTATATAIERDPVRATRIAGNARALGVPDLAVVPRSAPEALSELEAPQAIFVGGGLTTPGLLERCLAALAPGGRFVANAVTLESERILLDAHARHGGALTRLGIARASPIGGFTGWRPQMDVVQWELDR